MMEIKDTSNEPRSIEDIEEALEQVNIAIVTGMAKFPPRFFVLLPTMRECLIELLKYRKAEITDGQDRGR
jgi:hypothetical protein